MKRFLLIVASLSHGRAYDAEASLVFLEAEVFIHLDFEHESHVQDLLAFAKSLRLGHKVVRAVSA